MNKQKIDYAREYAEAGYKIIPLKADTKAPCFSGWKQAASNDPEQIQEWWSVTPNANIGVITDDFLVVDIDIKSGKNGADALAIGEYEIPPTPSITKTPNNGQHHWFKGDGKLCQNHPVEGVDIIASKSFIVGVGSSIEGKVYTGDISPVEELTEAPTWAYKPKAEFIPARRTETQGISAVKGDIQASLDQLDPTELSEEQWYKCGMAIQSEIPGEDGLKMFDEWSQKDSDRYKVGECAAKWSSWKPMEGGIGVGTLFKMADYHPLTATEMFSPVDSEFIMPNHLNEEVMVRAMNTHTGKSIHWCDGGWVIWNGSEWLRSTDADSAMWEHYHMMIDWLRSEANHAFSGDAKDGTKVLMYLARAKETRPREDFYRGYKTARGLSAGTWDSNGDVIAAKNGVYEISTGTFRPQLKTDFIRRTLGTEYVPGSECPMWLKFIQDSTGSDPDMMEYLQRLAGYFLTTDVGRRELYFLYGTTTTGKSTFVDVIDELMGGYSTEISSKTLLETTREGSANASIAMIENARMVRTDELPRSGVINASLVKSLTGDAVIIGEAKYKAPRPFRATGKLVMYGNHRPQADALDAAVWRRMRLIRFDRQVPKDKMIPNLSLKLQQEHPGILLWMIEGLRRYQEKGELKTPKSVLDATEKYRVGQDTVLPFVEDLVEPEVGGVIKFQELKAEYAGYCDAHGIVPQADREFTRALKHHMQQVHGSNQKRRPGGSVYLNVKLAHTGEF